MDITWRTNNLTLEQCARVLGRVAAELEQELADPAFVRGLRSRAAGAWTANDRETYAAMRSLGRLAGEDVTTW